MGVVLGVYAFDDFSEWIIISKKKFIIFISKKSLVSWLFSFAISIFCIWTLLVS